MKKNKIYGILSSLLIVAAIALFTDNYLKNKKTSDFVNTLDEQMQTEWQGKTLIFPDNLDPVNTDISFEDFHQTFGSEPVMVSYFDADCSTCVEDLKKWARYLETQKRLKNIFIASGSNKAMVSYGVTDLAKFTHPVYYDRENRYYTDNKLPNLKLYHTVLIQNGQVVLTGSPVQTQTAREVFEKTLKQMR